MKPVLTLLALGITLCAEVQAQKFSAAELKQRAIQRRAVEATIWGMPLVNVDAMRQPYFAAGAKYNDCIFWSNPNTWMNQTTTPNHSTSYVIFFMNLKDGPVLCRRSTGRPGVELDSYSREQAIFRHVPHLRPEEGALRENVEAARRRGSEMSLQEVVEALVPSACLDGSALAAASAATTLSGTSVFSACSRLVSELTPVKPS